VAPQKLRSFSPHLQQLESRVADSRARKIYRPNLIEETEGEEA